MTVTPLQFGLTQGLNTRVVLKSQQNARTSMKDAKKHVEIHYDVMFILKVGGSLVVIGSCNSDTVMEESLRSMARHFFE